MNTNRRILRWWGALLALAVLSGGVAAPLLQAKSKPKKEPPVAEDPSGVFFGDEDADAEDDPEQKYRTKIETPLIGDYTTFAGLNPIVVKGVGLVVGLSGTGGDPAPSALRTALMEDLKKRDVKNPNRIISSPDTALVEVWAYLPPLMKKGETVDVEVRIPESAQATSLHGGWLMETYLTEQAYVPGRALTGHQFVKAKGPVLMATLGADKGAPALKLKGRVLGGGTVLRERELAMFLKSDFRGIRNTIRVSDAISLRFHDFDKHGLKLPMAVAKTDNKIALNVHPRYKNNFPRYLNVIRQMAFKEQPTARQLRIQQLKQELLAPETAERASLQLEAIGALALPVLKAGLKSPLLECRFHAATALAYLEDDDEETIKVLQEAARDERAFRVFAYAALSTVDNAQANLRLRELMSEQSMETRYGAFRALWELDKRDPFIRGEKITAMDEKTDFQLHVLETKGEPLVHLSTRTRPEVVLFGADQKLSTPLLLSAGKNVLVTAQPGAQTASITRFAPNEGEKRREVPLNVADVIRAVSELDATYPDVVQLLMEADDQKNLPGRLTADALPESGRVYTRPVLPNGLPSKGSRKTRIGRDHLTPNLFPRAPSDDNSEKDSEDDEPQTDSAMANVPEETKQPDEGNSEGDAKDQDDKKPSKAKSSMKAKERTRNRNLPSWIKVHRFDDSEAAAAPEVAEPPKPKVKPPAKAKSEPEREAESEIGDQTEPK